MQGSAAGTLPALAGAGKWLAGTPKEAAIEGGGRERGAVLEPVGAKYRGAGVASPAPSCVLSGPTRRRLIPPPLSLWEQEKLVEALQPWQGPFPLGGQCHLSPLGGASEGAL